MKLLSSGMNASTPDPSKPSPEGQNSPALPSKVDTFPNSLVAKTAEQLKPYLREQNQAPQAAQIALSIASELYAGPLPHPEHYGRFEVILPGSANRILAMAEKEQGHRHFQENLLNIYPFIGITSGFVLAALCVISAVYLGFEKNNVGAALMLGIPVLGMIGWFVKARISATGEQKGAPEQDVRSSGRNKRVRK